MAWWWIPAAIVAVMVIGGLASWVRHRRATRSMRALAHERGWQYVGADQSLVHRHHGAPFGGGSRRRASYSFTGAHRGARFVAFEYRYTESDGDSSSTRRFTVAVLDLPAARSRLQLTRETGMSRFLGKLGLRDLQLESEQFNDTFRIDTDDDRFAYDVLHPRMMEWLLASGQGPFRFAGGHLLAWQPVPIEPRTAVRLLDYASDIRDRVPSYVWSPG
jgi:hypothetical protein